MEPGYTRWNGMEWNGMKWNETEWNGMEWNGMKWNEMEWNRVIPGGAEPRILIYIGYILEYNGFSASASYRDRPHYYVYCAWSRYRIAVSQGM